MAIRSGENDQRSERALPAGCGRAGWRLAAPAVMLLLTERPSHGYQLLSRLRPMLPRNAPPPDLGGLYRLLRRLENDGTVRSSWTANTRCGPARRVYELTDPGRDTLELWACSIALEMQAMSGLLAAYHGAATEDDVPDTNR